MQKVSNYRAHQGASCFFEMKFAFDHERCEQCSKNAKVSEPRTHCKNSVLPHRKLESQVNSKEQSDDDNDQSLDAHIDSWSSGVTMFIDCDFATRMFWSLAMEEEQDKKQKRRDACVDSDNGVRICDLNVICRVHIGDCSVRGVGVTSVIVVIKQSGR